MTIIKYNLYIYGLAILSLFSRCVCFFDPTLFILELRQEEWTQNPFSRHKLGTAQSDRPFVVVGGRQSRQPLWTEMEVGEYWQKNRCYQLNKRGTSRERSCIKKIRRRHFRFHLPNVEGERFSSLKVIQLRLTLHYIDRMFGLVMHILANGFEQIADVSHPIYRM